MEVLPEAYWQRCYVHFLRNAFDYLPRKGGDDCLIEFAMALRPARRHRSPQRSGGQAGSLGFEPECMIASSFERFVGRIGTFHRARRFPRILSLRWISKQRFSLIVGDH